MKKYFEHARRRGAEGIAYKHDLGQHFLYDEALLRSLVEATGVGKADGVLEIGPGAGTLTQCLCEAAGRVTAIEVDRDIIPFLRVATERFDNLTIVQGDVRRVDLREVCHGLGESFLVIANIPYNITTPILECLWHSGLPIRQISVMVQKEVADKLMAAPSTPAYGLLSVQCQYRSQPALVATVPAERFTPPPKVDSAFVRMDMRAQPPAPVKDENLLWRMVKAGFGMRRKTLTNALKGVVEAERLRAALEGEQLSPTVRGEALSVPQWIALSNACAVTDDGR
ncbi:MAG: 16S rRNA (adenine(1518)-N(6)/adenine(1519)-N(6))-dimethyltransferase RsmA [Clostridiales bacterium]|nr:16S rRNA (adenine(1518)-N(6)/adenine(1519)-N(6))-dimethyltransferase RsmA [Clostridiales bacterium]